jgi:predicted esterase|tara:strand:- start:13033 stop:14460 length:1428 start_codon:yes stop_codon:yes gene_type:complete
MLNLIYRMSKARADSDDEVKAQLADVDKRLTEARGAGRMGELRRQLARGMSLANGRGWSDAQDFNASLVVRTDQAFVDSTQPAMVRLEQIYPSTLQREGRFTARVALHKPEQGRRAVRQTGEKLHDLGELAEVGLDLIEGPIGMQIDLARIADGNYDIRFELVDGEESVGAAFTRLYVRANLNDRMARLRHGAAKAPAALRADILYPLDYMRKVNLGWVASRGFDVDKELAAAEEIAQAVAKGIDPFKARSGDFERHYLLADAGEIMPYRIYVPKDYPSRGQYPLVVALHGLGGNEDSMFGDFYGITALAEERGYIVVAPMGFRVDGGYGGYGQQPVTRNARLSEQDVLEVLALTRANYAIDPQRIYLMGHSMGAIGTWRLAARHPDIWAGLGPIAGWGNPGTAAAISHIPQIVVHGDADRTVPVMGSRGMVNALRKEGATVKFIEVPGGGHSDIAPPNMAPMFDFFDAHRRPEG